MKESKQYLKYILIWLVSLGQQKIYSQYISFFPDTIYACQNDTIKLTIPTDILSKSVNIQWITPYSIIYHSSSLNVYQEGNTNLNLKPNKLKL
ncbi:MAG: hypothetical protein KatS3mg027_2057 [Bacteroidia bacterium]|nr:MAG: hypothetical protein KatS3mg027_2057 [Bacteroidia bacterium]